jgi:hypothetical protein
LEREARQESDCTSSQASEAILVKLLDSYHAFALPGFLRTLLLVFEPVFTKAWVKLEIAECA